LPASLAIFYLSTFLLLFIACDCKHLVCPFILLAFPLLAFSLLASTTSVLPALAKCFSPATYPSASGEIAAKTKIYVDKRLLNHIVNVTASINNFNSPRGTLHAATSPTTTPKNSSQNTPDTLHSAPHQCAHQFQNLQKF
jgi:hypothetical protein